MNTKHYSIYQPTAAEIAHVTKSAARRHPDMAARIHKAQDLLLSGALQLDATAWDLRQLARWRIASQSHGGAYVVVGLACPCQDSRAPKVGANRCCKHSMAVSLYAKILRNHLNADIRAREIDLGILPDGTFNAYAKRLGHVHLCKNGTTYDFADAASMVRYSIWLAAQPIAVAWPVAHTVAA
jgi:hypothetical protein